MFTFVRAKDASVHSGNDEIKIISELLFSAMMIGLRKSFVEILISFSERFLGSHVRCMQLNGEDCAKDLGIFISQILLISYTKMLTFFQLLMTKTDPSLSFSP